MQLGYLKIENFRTITESYMEPAKINVITGPNGVGKSSTLEAISFLLTGKAGTNPVKDGETSTTVEGLVMGTPLLRKAGAKTSVKLNGKTTTQKSVQQWIEDSIGVTLDTIRVATSSGMLAAMNSRELATYLISNNLIPAEIDMDTIRLLCTMSPEAEAELLMYLPEAPVKFTMDDVHETYTQFFAARPIIKKQLAEKQMQANFTGMEPSHTLVQLDEELAKFAAYNSELAAYKKLVDIYEDAKRRREVAQKRVAEIEAKIRSNPVSPTDTAEYTFLLGKKKECEQTVLNAHKAIHTIESNLRMFKNTLVNLDKPVCPISEKLICTTDKSAIKEDLSKLVAENEALLQKAQDEMQKAKERMVNLDAKIGDYQNREKAYRDFQALHTQRSALMAGMPTIPEKPVPPEEIPDAEARVKELKSERELIFAKEAAKKAEKEIPELEARIKIYDELIALLKPQGGIREKIVEAAFEPMIDHCNERAKKIKPDFKVGLISDEGIHIVCKPAGVSSMLPLDSVSSGEQLITMLLILDAINALSNFGILMLDDLDKLDTDALNALFELLNDPEVTDPYDHIFVAMVNHEDSMKVIDKHKSIIGNLIALS